MTFEPVVLCVGWYRDPDCPHVHRYWNGSDWVGQAAHPGPSCRCAAAADPPGSDESPGGPEVLTS